MKCKHFKAHEVVPKKIYAKYGEDSWKFISKELITTIDTLKEMFPDGSMTINNYHWNGDREWSGVRTPDSPYYSETSMHSFGRAVDCIFSNYDVEEVRQYIIDNPKLFIFVKGIEKDVSWLHIDCRNQEHVSIFGK